MAGKADSVRTISMLAEAIHSYADSGNQGLLLWGQRRAKRPPTPDYPLGWHKLAQPQDLSYPWVAVGQSAEPQTEAGLRRFLQSRDEVEKVYRGRGRRGHQPLGDGAARRVSRDPVALLRAGHRGLKPGGLDR